MDVQDFSFEKYKSDKPCFKLSQVTMRALIGGDEQLSYSCRKPWMASLSRQKAKFCSKSVVHQAKWSFPNPSMYSYEWPSHPCFPWCLFQGQSGVGRLLFLHLQVPRYKLAQGSSNLHPRREGVWESSPSSHRQVGQKGQKVYPWFAIVDWLNWFLK